jgi:Sulfotransferase family
MATREEPVFAFVLGTGRCGSSLVHEVLARHPDIGFVSNLDDRLAPLGLKGRWNNAIYRRVPAALTRKGRIRFAPSEAYRILDRHVSPMISAPSRDLVAADASPWVADRFRTFFRDRARAQGTPVFSHKFTGWPRAAFIDAVFPEARYIHVIRDGRAVAASMVQMPWWRGFEGPEAWGWGPLPGAYRQEWELSGRSFPVLAGVQWKMLLDAFESARAAIDPARWLDVRYEDFLEDPGSTIETIVAFLARPRSGVLGRAIGVYRLDASRRNAFRRSLSRDDLDALNTVLAGHLQRYGYEDEGERGADALAT